MKRTDYFLSARKHRGWCPADITFLDTNPMTLRFCGGYTRNEEIYEFTQPDMTLLPKRPEPRPIKVLSVDKGEDGTIYYAGGTVKFAAHPELKVFNVQENHLIIRKPAGFTFMDLPVDSVRAVLCRELTVICFCVEDNKFRWLNQYGLQVSLIEIDKE